MTALAQMVERSSDQSVAASGARKGVFIVFEGIDGSGKSTVAKRVHEILSAEMPDRVVLTAEPSDSFIGEAVRRANSSNVDLVAEALLFVADRAEHTRQIRRWLEEGKVVISDRYYCSTIAYQGALLNKRLGGTKKAVEWLKMVNAPAIIHPDLTLVLTVKVSLALERLKARKDLTKFEDLDYLMDVDLIYRSLCMEDPTFHTLDASKAVEDVVLEAMRPIRSKL